MSVVFTDNFTVGADTNIDAYPTGSPDYAYNKGSGSNLTVNAANDRVQCPVASTDVIARIIRSGIPTGDQQVTADVGTGPLDNTGNPACRVATAGTADCYICYVAYAVPDLRFYRVDTGTFVLLASGGAKSGNTGSVRFKVTGAGATVSLEAQWAALGLFTFNDTAANRKTAGAPGMHFYNDNTNTGILDNISVDDLAVTGGNSVALLLKLRMSRN